MHFILSKKFAIYIIVAMHFFGFLFMQFAMTKDLFLSLTPLNLIISGALLLYHHKQSKLFYFFVTFAFLVGYFVELVGTKTGVIFGQYWYGSTLGTQLFDVPLLIGVNWAVLVVATNSLANNLTNSLFNNFNINIATWHTRKIVILTKAVLGAALMTSLDFLIEPVAIHLDFWQWQNNHIPTQNFIAWYFIAFFLHLIYENLAILKHNPIAVALFYSQVFFFGAWVVVL
jgi:putative membrane protein